MPDAPESPHVPVVPKARRWAVSLKPCPFCGGDTFISGFDSTACVAYCGSCKAQGSAYLSREGARLAWSKRPGEDEARREALAKVKAWGDGNLYGHPSLRDELRGLIDRIEKGETP